MPAERVTDEEIENFSTDPEALGIQALEGDVEALKSLVDLYIGEPTLKPSMEEVFIDVLKALGEPAIKEILGWQRQLDNEKEIPVKLAFAVGKVGSPAVSQLLPLLTDENPRMRIFATAAISAIKDEERENFECTVEPLIARLEDKEEDPRVREYAIYALHRINDPRARELFFNVLQDKEEEISVRHTAAYCVDVRNPHAFGVLIAALREAVTDPKFLDYPAFEAAIQEALHELARDPEHSDRIYSQLCELSRRDENSNFRGSLRAILRDVDSEREE